ncbi:MAG: two-component regulator propeller domain-containing protein [Candidatus Acetothermia bacterium]
MKRPGQTSTVLVLSVVTISLLCLASMIVGQQALGEGEPHLDIFSVYPGAEEMPEASDGLLMVFRGMSGGGTEGEARALVFVTADPLEKVVTYYRNNPPEPSWEMVLEVGSGEASYIALWKRNNETAQLVIGRDEGETTILIGFGKEGQGEESRWRTFTEEDGLVNDTPTVMVEGRDGSIWAGTTQGLLRYSNSEWNNYTDSPLGRGVSDIVVAFDGTLWVGTLDGGALRYDGTSWLNFTHGDGLVNDQVSSVEVGADGRIWVSSYRRRGGLSVYGGASWISYTKNNGLPSNYVYSVAVAPTGEVWAGTKGGLAYLNQGAWETVTKKDGLIDNGVEEVNVDGHGNMWAVTDAGVSRYDGRYWVNYPDNEFFPANDVFKTSIGPDGSIWFGTRQGISRFDGKNWSNYTAADGLPDEYVISLLATSTGEVWAGTISRGIWTGELE